MDTEFRHLEISGDGMPETAGTRTELRSTESISNASLDSLPAELKASILYSAPNIVTLKTLVRSSPLYHEAYLDERKSILSTVLLRDIGPQVLSDALAVHEASQIGIEGTGSRKDRVKAFLSQYKAERGSSSPATCDSLDIETLESLSRLQSVFTTITSDFCQTTLSVNPVNGERIQPGGELSVNEKRRIYRAFYRFELFRALFARSYYLVAPEDSWYFDTMDQSFLFLSIFNAWEVEELACVHDYIFRRHSEFLQESSSELSKLHPKKYFHSGRCFFCLSILPVA